MTCTLRLNVIFFFFLSFVFISHFPHNFRFLLLEPFSILLDLSPLTLNGRSTVQHVVCLVSLCELVQEVCVYTLLTLVFFCSPSLSFFSPVLPCLLAYFPEV